MKIIKKAGSTDQTILVFVPDSSSTTGAGLSGLVFNTSGLVCYYVRPGSAPAALTLATQTVTGAHADGGFVEVDATNMPGWYRLDLSDTIIAAGVDLVGFVLRGAANMGPCNVEIQLSAVDLDDATDFGLTALDSLTAPGTSGGLVRGQDTDSLEDVADAVWDEILAGHTTAGTSGQVVQDIDTNIDAVLVDTGTTIPDQITALNDISPAEVNTQVDIALADYDGPTNAEMEARTIASADYSTFDPDTDTTADGETYNEAITLTRAANVGKSSSNGTTFRDKDDTKNRIVATVDANGNRTAITTDAT